VYLTNSYTVSGNQEGARNTTIEIQHFDQRTGGNFLSKLLNSETTSKYGLKKQGKTTEEKKRRRREKKKFHM